MQDRPKPPVPSQTHRSDPSLALSATPSLADPNHLSLSLPRSDPSLSLLRSLGDPLVSPSPHKPKTSPHPARMRSSYPISLRECLSGALSLRSQLHSRFFQTQCSCFSRSRLVDTGHSSFLLIGQAKP